MYFYVALVLFGHTVCGILVHFLMHSSLHYYFHSSIRVVTSKI